MKLIKRDIYRSLHYLMYTTSLSPELDIVIADKLKSRMNILYALWEGGDFLYYNT